MTKFEKKVFKKLDLYENHTVNPIQWIKRNKKYGFIMIVCFLYNLPIYIIAKVLMAICYLPHKLYEELGRRV